MKKEKANITSLVDIIYNNNSLDEVLDQLFSNFSDLFAIDRLDVLLFKEDHFSFSLFKSLTGEKKDLQTEFFSDINSSQLGSVMKNKRARSIDLVSENQDDVKSELLENLMQQGIHSIIIAPLFYHTTEIGILIIGSNSIEKYSQENTDLINQIIPTLTLKVEAASMQYRLNQFNETYIETLGVISHEIKSPLASIISMAKTITGGYLGKLSDEQLDMLNRILSKTEYLHAVSNEYLNLSRLESGHMKINASLVDMLDTIVEPAFEVVSQQIRESEVQMVPEYIENIYPVECDPDLILIVMINLLSNAIKYGKNKGKIAINIKRYYARIRVSVWNEGRGFTEKESKSLFKKFSRIQSEEMVKKAGAGLGLYTSWKIINLHSGIIWAESDYNKWARFSFELPKNRVENQ